MAAATDTRLTDASAPVPSMGTFAAAANSLYYKGTIVSRDANGRAAVPSDGDGLPAMGVSNATYDNRTGSEAGGLNGSIDIEVTYGVFAFDVSGTAPKPGDMLYVVDNQTLSVDSNGGTRGAAGPCIEYRDSQAYCWFGPQNGWASLEANASTANAVMPIPLASFLDADGDPLAKFVSAASPTFGFALADSEALCLRWNNDPNPGTALCQIAMPPDLDEAAPAYLEFLASKSGATVGDATTLTITAFIIGVGDLHDADANAGGVSNALVGNAAAKTTALLSRTIAAADIPANARSMTFTVTPTAGTLGTDDLLIHDVRLRYTRKLLSA